MERGSTVSLPKRSYASAISNAQSYKRVCYYTDWSQYRRVEELRFFPHHVLPALHLCTHLVYAFATLDGETLSLDEPSDHGEKILELKKRNPSLKVLISVGGWNNAGKGFVDIVRTPSSRGQFNVRAVQWLRRRGYDGLDVDWEYPGAAERGSSAEDKTRFALWLRELNFMFEMEAAATGKKKLLLTAAVPASAYWVRKG